MGNSNIVTAGGNAQADYLAFGDDSQFGDTLVYAFAIVHRSRVRMLEHRLSVLKQSFNIPEQHTLHCRILFSGQQRKKIGLGHLTEREVQRLVARAIKIINRGQVIVRYTVGNLAEIKAAIPDEIEMFSENNGSTIRQPVNVDPKGILGILAQGCFAVPPDGSKGPTATQCKIVASKDSTKVTFIGPRRKRADRMYSGFSDIGAPDGHVFQLNPTAIDAAGEPLLQLADIVAYVCSHASNGTEGSTFFRAQLKRLRSCVRSTFVVDPELIATRAQPG